MQNSGFKKNVCAHYISSYLPRTENWIYKIILNLQKFQPVILTRKTENLDEFPFTNIASLDNLNKFQFYYNFGIFKIRGYFPLFKDYCLKSKTKILHAHFGYHGIKSIELKKKLNVPLICSFYGNDVFKWPSVDEYKIKLKFLFEEAAKIIALGPYMKKDLIKLGCPDHKVEIQHLGVDVDNIKFIKKNIPMNKKINFLIASSFVPKKGIEDVINALGLIKNEFEFKLDIIGDGPLKNEIIESINKNNLTNYVYLHGYQPYHKVIDFAYHSHIFLQASKTAPDNDKEGTPMIIADAMATGLPVISTLHSDIPEMVIDEFNGYLAEEDNPADFAKAILKLVKNHGKIEEFSTNARKHIEQSFNTKIQAQKLEKIYFDIIN